MRRKSSSSSIDAVVGRAALAAMLALAATLPAGAATVLEKTVAVTLDPPSRSVEKHHLRVRLETPEDVETWESFPVYVDDHRRLLAVDAWSQDVSGKRSKVGRKDQDTVQVSADYELYGSSRYEVLTFSGLEVGGEVDLTWEVEVSPYYPAGQQTLRSDDPIERLEVTVTGGGEGFRYRLDGASDGLEVVEAAGGVTVRGTDLEAVETADFAPGGLSHLGVLRYGWGDDATWDGVGRWYTGLLADVPNGNETVKAKARELVAGLGEARPRLEELLAFLRGQVRYVAVEVGIGGFKPSPPGEVLERRWGDCKDKSLLLVDLLREAGIEAHPALVRSGRRERIDPLFPSPDQFNHLIVAVPAADALALAGDDPVAGGYLFLDPTQTRGSARWLHPGVQDQDALVIKDGHGELVRTPIKAELEARELVVNLRLTPEGDALGGAGLSLTGRLATGFLEQMSTAAPERTEEDVRAIFGRLLPGVTLGDVGWQAEEDGVPKVSMMAGVKVDGLVQGIDRGRPSLRLESFSVLPEPRLVDEREEPVVLTAGTATVRWHLTLTDGLCRPDEAMDEVSNGVGSFRQSVAHLESPSSFTLERRSVVRTRWVEPEGFAELRELALAESRAERRRIRLGCEETP